MIYKPKKTLNWLSKAYIPVTYNHTDQFLKMFISTIAWAQVCNETLNSMLQVVGNQFVMATRKQNQIALSKGSFKAVFDNPFDTRTPYDFLISDICSMGSNKRSSQHRQQVNIPLNQKSLYLKASAKPQKRVKPIKKKPMHQVKVHRLKTSSKEDISIKA